MGEVPLVDNSSIQAQPFRAKSCVTAPTLLTMSLATYGGVVTRRDWAGWPASGDRDVPLFECPMDQESDENLMLRVAARDQAAFGALYDRFSGSLHALVRRILEDDQEAVEVLQEGFLYLWEHAPSYDPTRSKAFTWLWLFSGTRPSTACGLCVVAAVWRTRRQNCCLLWMIARSARIRLQTARSVRNWCVRPCWPCLKTSANTLNGPSLKVTPIINWQNFSEPLGTVKTHIRRGLVRLRDLLKGGLS